VLTTTRWRWSNCRRDSQRRCSASPSWARRAVAMSSATSAVIWIRLTTSPRSSDSRSSRMYSLWVSLQPVEGLVHDFAITPQREVDNIERRCRGRGDDGDLLATRPCGSDSMATITGLVIGSSNPRRRATARASVAHAAPILEKRAFSHAPTSHSVVPRRSAIARGSTPSANIWSASRSPGVI
jgi:hypothetical protein